MKKILFALVAMLSWAAFGQTAQIRGRVIDTNNFPLPGATVVLVSIIAVTLLKQVVFKGVPRPVLFLSEVLPAHWNLEQFQIRFNKLNSFPSGHTTTAAVLGLYAMKFFKSRIWCHGCYVMIWLVGISRVFLFQHFIVDVVAGILLAFTSVYISELIIYHVFSKSKAHAEVPQVSAIEQN